MKPIHFRPTTPRPQRGTGGFTLVELLVSMTVLALILALVAQLTNSAGQTVTNSGKHTDSDSQSRLLFSRFGQDLVRLVKRRDVDFSTFKQPLNAAAGQPANLQVGNDQLAFYSETPGGYSPTGTTSPASFGSSARAPLSLVAYQVAAEPTGGSTVLRRLAKALGWELDGGGKWANPVYLPLKLTDLRIGSNPIQLFSADPTNPASPVDPDCATIGDMVFRFEYAYLIKSNPTTSAGSPTPAPARLSVTPYDTKANPPHTTVNGLQDVAAIVVTLGVLDSTSRVIASKDKDQVAKLVGIFPDAVDGQDTLRAWQTVLAKPTFASDAGLPRAAAAGVRLYQRTFFLEPN